MNILHYTKRIFYFMVVYLGFHGHQLAVAGHLIQTKLIDYHTPPTAYRALALLDSQKVKVNTTQFTGRNSDLLYDASQDVMWDIQHDGKNYVKINSGSLQKVQNTVQNAFDTMMSAFSGEEDMEEGPQSSQYRVSKVGGAKQIEGLSCAQYAVFENGVKVQDIWVTDWEQAGISKSAFNPLRKMAHFYGDVIGAPGMRSVFPDLPHIPVKGLLQIDGYPVRLRQYRGGKLEYELSARKPQQGPLRPVVFEVPKDYEKKWF